MQKILETFYPSLVKGVDMGDLLSMSSLRTFKSAQRLLAENNYSGEDGIALITSGKLESRKSVPNFGECPINTYQEGAFIGFVHIFDGLPQPYSLYIADESDLVLFPRQAIDKVFSRNSMVNFVLKKLLLINISRELRVLNNILTGFFRKDLQEEKRLASARIKQRKRQEDDEGYKHKFMNLKNFKIFSSLKDYEIDLLTTLTRSIILEKDELVFPEGDMGDAVYFIIHGEIRISKFIPDVGEEALVLLKEGDFFGEMAFIDPSPRSAYAIANTSPTVVYSISHQALTGLFEISQLDALRILDIFGNILASRLRKTLNTVQFWKILQGNF